MYGYSDIVRQIGIFLIPLPPYHTKSEIGQTPYHLVRNNQQLPCPPLLPLMADIICETPLTVNGRGHCVPIGANLNSETVDKLKNFTTSDFPSVQY